MSRLVMGAGRLAFVGAVVLSVTGGGLAVVPPAHAATPRYTLSVGPDAVQRYLGVNGNGDIIGTGQQVGAQNGEGFVIKAGTNTPVFLSTAGDPGNTAQFTTPHSISDDGVVVGDIFPFNTSIHRAARWSVAGATGVDLGVDPSQPFFDVEATAVNGGGLVAGRTVDPASKVTAWTVTGTTITKLPFLPGGAQGRALAVNGTGLAVGSSAISTTVVSAAAWQNGQVRDLGLLPGGDFAEADAVNSAGVAVGVSNTAPGGDGAGLHAVKFSGGTVTDLNIPGTTALANATATGINDSGVIIGSLPNGGAYVYRDGVATDLNTLIPPNSGFHITKATGINNNGVIVGIAQKGFGGRTFGVVLTPA